MTISRSSRWPRIVRVHVDGQDVTAAAAPELADAKVSLSRTEPAYAVLRLRYSWREDGPLMRTLLDTFVNRWPATPVVMLDIQEAEDCRSDRYRLTELEKDIQNQDLVGRCEFVSATPESLKLVAREPGGTLRPRRVLDMEG